VCVSRWQRKPSDAACMRWSLHVSQLYCSWIYNNEHSCDEFAPNNRDSCRADGSCLQRQHSAPLWKRFLLAVCRASNANFLSFLIFH
jgi:hypothetical protein